jgi:aminoglycoside phosphotransferase (APT) family kinase protein
MDGLDPDGADLDLVASLVAQDLISPSVIVGGTVVIEERHGRSGGNVVHRSDADPVFVKWQGEGPQAVTIAHEARILAVLAGDPTLARLAPGVHRFDPARGCLIVEFIRGEGIRTAAGSLPGGSEELLIELGRALASVHRGCPAGARSDVGDAEVAWVLSLHRPRLADLTRLSAGSLELLRALQRQPRTCDRIDALRRGWRSEALVHGDVRWENLIACDVAGGGASRVRLVDWESAGLGDPAWDLGCTFAQLLSDWLVSMPAPGGTSSTELPAPAGQALESVKTEVRAVRAGYVERAGRSALGGELLRRSVGCAGLRLMQFGVELAQPLRVPDRRCVAHMQLGANVLGDPERAAAVLLGLPPDG